MLSLCRQTDGWTNGWTDRRMDRQTDRQTSVKQYAPDLSIWGHKKNIATQSSVPCLGYEKDKLPINMAKG